MTGYAGGAFARSVTIANGASNSTSLNLSGVLPTGILFPAAMTGGNVKIEVSFDSVNFFPLRVNGGGGDVAIDFVANTLVAFDNLAIFRRLA